MQWVKKQLLPNLKNNSVVIVDNASYHNTRLETRINSSTLKKDMVAWLNERNIIFDSSITKPELYEIIKNNRNDENDYVFDNVLNEHGHQVLRLPPYHPEFNPIEKIWALVKNWVAAHNTTFKLDDVEKLARHKFEAISQEDWLKICRHSKKCEKEWMDKDDLLDDNEEMFQFTINTASSDEEMENETSETE